MLSQLLKNAPPKHKSPIYKRAERLKKYLMNSGGILERAEFACQTRGDAVVAVTGANTVEQTEMG